MVWLVTTGRTGGFDRSGLLSGAHAATSPPARARRWLLETVRDVTALGGVFLRNLFALGAVVALLFLSCGARRCCSPRRSIGGWLVNSAIKALVGRPRPEIVPHLTEAGGASFPSGHSFNSAVVYIAMALAFASLSRAALGALHDHRHARWC